ncbi:hypothetical protein GM3708_1910 [Geminocystis sp. NIES-3708]|nr:hypothetical protein GM3708_1910 [Geminocystis sp. NIES-3708]
MASYGMSRLLNYKNVLSVKKLFKNKELRYFFAGQSLLPVDL